MSKSEGYKLGFENLLEELQNQELKLEGALPSWLSGSYILNGSGQHSFKKARYNHWFDGLAMLKKFEIKNGKVYYSNRFIKSKDYLKNTSRDTITYTTFGTNSSSFPFYLWEKVLAMNGVILSDNASVTIHKFGEDAVALTELDKAIKFDIKDLSTLGPYDFQDNFRSGFSTAHPHYDYKRNKIYNLGIKMGLPSTYIFYEVDTITKSRKILKKISSFNPSYSHSFAVTEDYIILSEYSFRINPLELLFTTKTVSEGLYYDHKNPIKFQVIEKDTGKIVKIFESKPNFGFHHANAYQEGEEIILDLMSGPDQNIFTDLKFEKILDESNFKGKIVTNFERFKLSLRDGKVSSEFMIDEAFEFPNIDYKSRNGQKYQYVYGAGFSQKSDQLFWDSLIKIDLNNQKTMKWSEENCYIGEPFFISSGKNDTEDDGLVLSVVLDSNRKQSFILFLDAQNMTEVARAYVSHMIPFSFHGQFFSA